MLPGLSIGLPELVSLVGVTSLAGSVAPIGLVVIALHQWRQREAHELGQEQDSDSFLKDIRFKGDEK